MTVPNDLRSSFRILAASPGRTDSETMITPETRVLSNAVQVLYVDPPKRRLYRNFLKPICAFVSKVLECGAANASSP